MAYHARCARPQIGIFVNGPMMGHADKALVDFWRGYQSLETLALLPPDNTVKCKDRLRFGTSCTDKEVRASTSSCGSQRLPSSEREKGER